MDLTNLPAYIPIIRPGAPRSTVLNTDIVALSLYEVLRVFRTNESYAPLDAKEFRRRLHLREHSKIILVGVAEDRLIESFYEKFLVRNFPRLLAGVEISAITTPNFSFFEDVPRVHIVYNRLRGLQVAKQFLAANIPAIPHLNFLTEGDLRAWKLF